MSSPQFSILVPTYNQEQYVGDALESILQQTVSDWEAIVVNDGSTDATAEVIDRYAARDSRIRVIHQKNQGTAGALNTALQSASGTWIGWLSSDDLFEANKLEIHQEWIGRHPETKFFITYFKLLRQATGECRKHDLWGPLPQASLQVPGFLYRNYVSGISICVHNSVFEEIGGFDPELRYAQDYDLWLRILSRYQATFIPRWTVINRNHADQGSEVFPMACYWDTAKSGIRFLNSHKFEDWFPLLDFSRPEAARMALLASLDIACREDALLYGMGVHSGIFDRITEWFFNAAISLCDLQALQDELKMKASLAMAGSSENMHQIINGFLNDLDNKTEFKYIDLNVLARQRMLDLSTEAPHHCSALHVYGRDYLELELSIPSVLSKPQSFFWGYGKRVFVQHVRRIKSMMIPK